MELISTTFVSKHPYLYWTGLAFVVAGVPWANYLWKKLDYLEPLNKLLPFLAYFLAPIVVLGGLYLLVRWMQVN